MSQPVAAAQWFTDYTKLGASAGIFYGYVFGLSFILWLVLRYLRADMKLVDMFCVYGESLALSLCCLSSLSLSLS